MTSVPAAAPTPIPARFVLPTAPTIPGLNVEREPLEAFRLAVATFVAEQWDEDVQKVLLGVDNGG